MGIPKFFRYISERWPMILQQVEPDKTPGFDYLYLDMNSIFHMATHSNDVSDDVGKGTTDEVIYSRIFTYIDHIFLMIKPTTIIYMAIDGVAPRAKMNQQRSRRIRTAMDAEKAIDAMKNAIGEENWDSSMEPFDKNSITPGTEFMAQLTINLKYFIHEKKTNDSNWRDVQVIFSGHEVPGEGEHKIMDYIRKLKSQRDYDPNSRHCIYGSDADLIILGLSTHIPHLAVLREEMIFGRKKDIRAGLEAQNFLLLHMSILREYLELEFEDLKTKLSFKYDFERIIDDFVLILFVIGNDFLPNLPDLHLNKGAFPVILETFKKALMSLDSYINFNGTINLERLGVWLDYLSHFEFMNFKQKVFTVQWFNEQLNKIPTINKNVNDQNDLQKKLNLINSMLHWVTKMDTEILSPSSFAINREQIKDIYHFFNKLSEGYGFEISKDQSENYIISKTQNANDVNYIKSSLTELLICYEDLIKDQNKTKSNVQDIYNEDKFKSWKQNYYKSKLEFSETSYGEDLRNLTANYVEGLQWVLDYYYKECPSWSWYYKYHYAPRISDLRDGLKQRIVFDQDEPFTPFQQLMAVLPSRSSKLIPSIFRPLMLDPSSPIIDFYPTTVKFDKNGKAADWEAVVLISFVDQDRLINAMKPFLNLLTPEEASRNAHGSNIMFFYDSKNNSTYQTSLKGAFKDIINDKCIELEFTIDVPEEVKYGFLKGTLEKSNMRPKFPSLYYLKFTNKLLNCGCLIFESPTQQSSMSINIPNRQMSEKALQKFILMNLGKVAFTSWPYLELSRVTSFITDEYEYTQIGRDDNDKKKGMGYISRKLTTKEKADFHKLKTSIIRKLQKTSAVILQSITVLVKVQCFERLEKNINGSFKKIFKNNFEYHPLQVVIFNGNTKLLKEFNYTQGPSLSFEEQFPKDTFIVCLGKENYGNYGQIVDNLNGKKLHIKCSHNISPDDYINLAKQLKLKSMDDVKYYPTHKVCKLLKISPLFLANITSRFVVIDAKDNAINIAIPMRFKNIDKKIMGYTYKNNNLWMYSEKAINLLLKFKKKFPALFQRLSNTKDRFIRIKNIFPDVSADDLITVLKDVKKWINEETVSFIKVSNSCHMLNDESVQCIEEYQKSRSNELIDTNKSDLITNAKFIKRPETFTNNLISQTFNLGDRILFVQSYGKVPFASKGTVIGLDTLNNRPLIRVICDSEITSATNYGGILQTQRIVTSDASDILNLSNKQFGWFQKKENTDRRDLKNKSTTSAADKERVSVRNIQNQHKKVQLQHKEISKNREVIEITNELTQADIPVPLYQSAISKPFEFKTFDS
ncbi:hypothetical protein TPHA_0D00960 [Tetrapisispora phaffii CBS 4417]|uniref:5'-3' exoribonuclease 1 n=1 Tax=Tetrapisispora phaffii (strain ATCC 24235 / CBS 4417 / NBRC 1672 / NRRL Y-8282 / UCD 70-5) TaxID=1071381 RepID=G8BSB6_TETPH|nr:hypothetical protein TPHA_0D00960 [Tetrapisispora phaffii CBS 4417]CCE62737.1 hypothetical protein TPHA_0D00960 [Tetrapisispora phaffii CBS 4417]